LLLLLAHIIIIIISSHYYYYYYYYYYYLLQLSFLSVTAVLTLIQIKQIRIKIHKRNSTKTQYKQYKTQYIQAHILPKHPHITKPTCTHTHTLQNPHVHTPTHYKTHTYTHPHITKPTCTHTHTLQYPHLHTPTHYKIHMYTHPHVTKPTCTHTHTLQNKLKQPHYKFKQPQYKFKQPQYKIYTKRNSHNTIKYPQYKVTLMCISSVLGAAELSDFLHSPLGRRRPVSCSITEECINST